MNEIKKINIKDIDSFKKHPFLVNVDVFLYELADSIKENGLLNPIVVRKKRIVLERRNLIANLNSNFYVII